MYGDFDTTVVKMVRSHLAPDVGDTDPKIHCVHRLDYATSGILCIALNKKAAHIASKVFELRLASKSYVALVYGHVKVADLASSKVQEGLPPLPLTLKECRRVITPCKTVEWFYGQHRRSTKAKLSRGEALSPVEKVLISTRYPPARPEFNTFLPYVICFPDRFSRQYRSSSARAGTRGSQGYILATHTDIYHIF